MTRFLLVNGPNLNTLGTREPQIYGTTTLLEIVDRLRHIARESNAELVSYQSNHEGALIDFLQGHAASEGAIINPGGLAHTSIVLRDAVKACAFPVVEVHISDVMKREPFRHHSYLKDVTANQIVGMGVVGYEVALRWLIEENGKK
jgi:3-dehydroquinate dehydratase-2